MGTGSGVDKEATAAAEEDADAVRLVNAEDLPDGVATAILQMTVAKMRLEGSRRIVRSN